MSVENLTIAEAREKLAELGEIQEVLNIKGDRSTVSSENEDAHPYEVGKNYLIRTVTMTQVGRMKRIYKNEIVLSDASWIPDTGRFQECLEKSIEHSDNSEVEMFCGDVIIGRGAISDCVEYKHDLPKEKK